MKEPDPKVLGQILLLQSAISVAANSMTMGEQTCHILRAVPGLIASALRINGKVVAMAPLGVAPLEVFLDRSRQDDAYLADDEALRLIEVLPAQTARAVYGALILAVSDREAFDPYVPYVQNTANMIALVVENWAQAQELQSLNANLELQVTERTKELKESEERYRLVVQASNEGIWDWDLMTDNVYYSHRWKEMLGYADDELENKLQTWKRLIHPDDLPVALKDLEKHFQENKPYSHTLRYLHKDGSWRWIHSNGFALRDDAGKPYRMIGNHRDITEQKIAEDALKRAKETAEAANQAKDQFIAVLSHELRTPLTPALAAAAALVLQTELPGDVLADLRMIYRNVDLEAKLIDDLLDVTRISRGKIELHHEVVDLHACFRSALGICQREIEDKRLGLSLRLHAAQHHVWADPARLQQVFWNLLKNAVKFSPEQGTISVKTTNIDGKLHLEISDTGSGITPEVLPRIFNVFEQGEQSKLRQFGGLGLGLSIAKAVVELHNGTLTAASEGRDKGATFSLELAVIPVAAESPTTPTPAVAPCGTCAQRILLVDDNSDTLRILSKLLQKWGYIVTTADCVQSALDQTKKRPFDLLVSDLGLPDGSGLDIMKSVKKLYGLRGLAISGFGTEDDIRQSRSAGFEEHLVKPVNFQVLQRAIEQIAPGCPVV